jgi:hypothetical protein
LTKIPRKDFDLHWYLHLPNLPVVMDWKYRSGKSFAHGINREFATL